MTGTGPDVVARVERMVDVADLVKASDEDLETLYPGAAYAESAAALLERGPAAVVVTRGADGALWLDREGPVEIASRPVRGGGHDRCGRHLRGRPGRRALGARPARRRGAGGAGRRCRAPRSPRCSSTPPGPRPSPSRGRAPTRRTGTSSADHMQPPRTPYGERLQRVIDHEWVALDDDRAVEAVLVLDQDQARAVVRALGWTGKMNAQPRSAPGTCSAPGIPA